MFSERKIHIYFFLEYMATKNIKQKIIVKPYLSSGNMEHRASRSISNFYFCGQRVVA